MTGGRQLENWEVLNNLKIVGNFRLGSIGKEPIHEQEMLAEGKQLLDKTLAGVGSIEARPTEVQRAIINQKKYWELELTPDEQTLAQKFVDKE